MPRPRREHLASGPNARCILAPWATTTMITTSNEVMPTKAQGRQSPGLALFIRQSLQPQRRLRVARHAPVAARRQADRADLGAVRQTGALELIGEEARQKHAQPLPQFDRCVFPVKSRLLCEVQNLLRRRTIAQEVEQKEVV